MTRDDAAEKDRVRSLSTVEKMLAMNRAERRRCGCRLSVAQLEVLRRAFEGKEAMPS